MPTSGPDQAAPFAEFMRVYQDMVYSTAVRILADPAQAEDIAQTVFLKAYQRFAELKASATAPGWLKTVATNLSINHLQRYRKRLSFLGDWRGEGDDGETPVAPQFAVPDNAIEGVSGEQRHALVEAALQALPVHQRVPLVLFHFEEMPYQDIAARLRVSVAKVKSDIFRGRAALAKHLGADDVLD